VGVGSFGFGDPEEEARERAGSGRGPSEPRVSSPESAARDRSGADRTRTVDGPRGPDGESEARERTGSGSVRRPREPGSAREVAEEESDADHGGQKVGAKTSEEPQE
jgi:hypothetical protein